MRIFQLLSFLLASLFIARLSAVEVVERAPDAVNPYEHSSDSKYSTQKNTAEVNAELFIKLQQLEVEVSELRGLLEQQSYLIEQLTQRRLADYVDLDRRINAMTSGEKSATSAVISKPVTTSSNTSSPAAPKAATPVVNKPAIPAPAASADQAKVAYQAAYAKVKGRQFDDAKVALTAYVIDYPNSYYVPNAHFWLGELHYLASDLPKARDAFYILVTQHANYRKVPDAKLKLGKIYHQLGDNEKAKAMLQSVINDHPDSKAVSPARDYLNKSLQ
jgi:tol-pal system protein YbgF